MGVLAFTLKVATPLLLTLSILLLLTRKALHSLAVLVFAALSLVASLPNIDREPQGQLRLKLLKTNSQVNQVSLTNTLRPLNANAKTLSNLFTVSRGLSQLPLHVKLLN